MAERLAAGGIVIGALGVLRWLSGALAAPADPGVLVAVVLAIGWGHLLGAVLGDARRLARLEAVVAPRSLVAALGLLGFATLVAAGSAGLGSAGVHALLLATAAAHIFENEAACVSASGRVGLAAGALSPAALLGAAAPTLALLVLALRARTAAEVQLWAPPHPPELPLGFLAAGLCAAALVWPASRGRGGVAAGLLAASATPALMARVSGTEIVAAATLYHYLRFALRLARSRAGILAGALAHGVPVSVLAAGGVVPALVPVASLLLEPGLFLLGASVHSLHTTVARWAFDRSLAGPIARHQAS